MKRQLFCQHEPKRSIPKGMLFRFGGTTLSLEPTAKRQFILSEQEKMPCYGVFSTRYPTKQGVSEVKLVFARETTMRLGEEVPPMRLDKKDAKNKTRDFLGFYSFIVFSIIPSSSLPVRFTMISGSSFIPRLTQLTSVPINT